jgi:Tol biopolymer transport system component
MSFLGEIKRRKVFQVAAVYAVVAWLLIQIVGAVSEPLSLPDWLDTVIIVLLAAGFPIALIFAWAFDVTPQGIRSDADVKAGGAQTRRTGQHFSYVVQVLVLVAVGFLVFDQYVLEPGAMRTEPRGIVSDVVRFSVPLPEGQSFTGDQASMIAISPDGTQIAYAANRRIYLLNLSEMEPREIQGTAETEGRAMTPAFSPDGRSLAYVHSEGIFESHVVKTVPIEGGTPVQIYDTGGGPANFPHGLSWAVSDEILFANADGIVRLPANGGQTELLIPRDEDERFFSPQLMPDLETVLYTRVPSPIGGDGGFDSAQVVMQSIGTIDRTVIVEGGSAPQYLSTGHVIYAQGTTLYTIPFNPVARVAVGDAVPIIQNLSRASGSENSAANVGVADTANVAISSTGTLVRISGTAPSETTLVWVDRGGQELEQLPVPPDRYTSARISPDGSKIALQVNDEGITSIWLFDQRTGSFRLLTGNPAGDGLPVWSSDSRRVFFRSFRDGSRGIYAIDTESLGATAELIKPFTPEFSGDPWTISPDDQTLVLVDGQDIQNIDVVSLSLASGVVAPLLDSELSESEPSVSGNGAWLAHIEWSNASDSMVNLRPFPDASGPRFPVGPGFAPSFSRDGSEVLFVEGGVMTSVAIEYVDQTPTLGAAVPLFDVSDYVWLTLGRQWEIDPSGERFLLIRRPPPANDRIDITLNWQEELRARAPTD